MFFPDTLPRNEKYIWSFDDGDKGYDSNAQYVKTYYHPISGTLNYHVHDFYELNIVAEGTGRHYVGQRNIPTQAGDIFVIPPGIGHGYASAEDLVVFHILLSELFRSRFTQDLEQLPGYRMLFEVEPVLRSQTDGTFYISQQGKQWEDTRDWMDRIQKYSRKAYGGHNIQQAFCVLTLISSFCEQLSETGLNEELPNQQIVTIIRSIEQIESRFQQKLSFRELAAQCGMSYSTWLRLFKRTTGKTPGQYQQECRLKKATELLRSSQETILSIALSCGYYDSSHFIREFTASKGISPTEYRVAAPVKPNRSG